MSSFLLCSKTTSRPFRIASDFIGSTNRIPLAPHRTWGVYEQGSENFVGVTSLFPRIMWINGSMQLCDSG